MNCYSFGSHLLSWQISANFRFLLKAAYQRAQSPSLQPGCTKNNLNVQ